jgi:hypothetical protein
MGDGVPLDEVAGLLEVERLPVGVVEHLGALVADADGDVDLRGGRNAGEREQSEHGQQQGKTANHSRASFRRGQTGWDLIGIP